MFGISIFSLVMFNMWRIDFFKSYPAASCLNNSLQLPWGSRHFFVFNIFNTSSKFVMLHGALFLCVATTNLLAQSSSFNFCNLHNCGCIFRCLTLFNTSSRQIFFIPSGLLIRFPDLSFNATGLLSLSF